MSINLYDTTVAIIVRDLQTLKKILKLGEKWCDEQGKPHSVLLEGKLAPDMNPLPFQVQTCCTYGLYTITRIGTSKAVPIEDNEKTFAELYDRIDRSVEILKTAKREDYNEPNKIVELRYPGFSHDFTALSYVQRMILPNFFFHSTTVYLILRNAGVPVGKRDFLDVETIRDP